MAKPSAPSSCLRGQRLDDGLIIEWVSLPGGIAISVVGWIPVNLGPVAPGIHDEETMGVIRIPARHKVRALQMREQWHQRFGLGGGIVDFHPIFNAGGGQDHILGILDGLGNPVAGLFQQGPDLHALEGAGVIMPVIRENQDLQVAPLLLPIAGTHCLKLVIKSAEQVEDIAVEVLGVVRGANIDIIAVVVAGVVPEVSERFVDLELIRVNRIDVTHGAKQVIFQLPMHLAFVLHGGGDAVDDNLRIRRRAEIRALITGQRAVAENVGPRHVARGRKRRDEAAGRKISLAGTERLPVEWSSPDIGANDTLLQGLHVAVSNSIQAQNQPPGKCQARGRESRESQQKKEDAPAHTFARMN